MTVIVKKDLGNRPPVAVDDNVTTDQNTPVSIALPTNDFDTDEHPIAVNDWFSPDHGTVVLDDDLNKLVTSCWSNVKIFERPPAD